MYLEKNKTGQQISSTRTCPIRKEEKAQRTPSRVSAKVLESPIFFKSPSSSSPHFHTAGASEASEGHPSMAPKQRTPHTCRNPDLIRGVGKYSRSQMYHKRGLWAIKAKNGGKFPTHEKKPAEAAVAVKPPKFYPADDVKKPLVNKRKARPTKLRLIYTITLQFFSIVFQILMRVHFDLMYAFDVI